MDSSTSLARPTEAQLAPGAEAYWVTVTERIFSKFVPSFSTRREPALKVEYRSGPDSYKEWMSVEYERARPLVAKWWNQHEGLECAPRDVDEALSRVSELRPVSEIRVELDGKYWRITGRRFAARLK